LTGDITAEVEQKLVWRKIINGPVDILKVAHHGSKEATSQELLEAITPKEAVISVGKQNRFGHPTKEVLDRLKERGIKINRTDLSGQIEYVF
jgi:competence protein ComEC